MILLTVSLQAPLSMGILQARILEWVAIPFSRGSSGLRDRTHISCIAGRFFTTEPQGKPLFNYTTHHFHCAQHPSSLELFEAYLLQFQWEVGTRPPPQGGIRKHLSLFKLPSSSTSSLTPGSALVSSLVARNSPSLPTLIRQISVLRVLQPLVPWNPEVSPHPNFKSHKSLPGSGMKARKPQRLHHLTTEMALFWNLPVKHRSLMCGSHPLPKGQEAMALCFGAPDGQDDPV